MLYWCPYSPRGVREIFIQLRREVNFPLHLGIREPLLIRPPARGNFLVTGGGGRFLLSDCEEG